MKIISLFSESLCFISQFGYGMLRNNKSQIAAKIRTYIFGGHCYIDTSVYITNRKGFHADFQSALYHGVYILNKHGQVTLGSQTHLGAYCYINAHYGTVTIGNGVAVGPGTKIIAYSNHYSPGSRVVDKHLQSDIIVGSNVFIGANCIVLPGTHISDHVIVGAGSLVRGNLEQNSVYAGTPCRKIKSNWHH